MAQRTAFLNSDAKGYNKDFHHTWIHNYLLHQVGVMFTDYNTKNEFKLGNGQISGGKAIIRCTRTTGNFAGSKMLALFESTATESISTSGDKKVFIEIPEIYVNDSTAITDTLTQGLNLGVGVIKSEADYPSHTNYIPLWEITGGDWEQAVDVRPEILARGKPNTISYIDNNGVQRNIMLDASSLNKFLKSNGAGVAPSWADVGDVVEVSNFKNTFFAGEDLLPKSMFRMESELDTVDAVDESIRFGYDTDSAKVQLNTILSGEEGDYVKLNLEGFNTPADNVNVRIETVDSSGNATGTLINPDATATINPSGTLEEMSINLAGMIDGTTAGQEVAVVLSRSGALSTSNYYKVGVATADTGIWKVKTFDGTSWNLETGKKGYISSPLFMEEGAIQSKATTEFLAETTGYVEAGATAGNEFTGVRFGMIEYDGFKPGDKVFLTDTGELSTTPGTEEVAVGVGVSQGIVDIGSSGVDGGGGMGVGQFDVTVAADGSGDFLTVYEAINAGYEKIFIKDGEYTEQQWVCANKDLYISGASVSGVKLGFAGNMGSGSLSSKGCVLLNNTKGFSLSNVTINVTLNDKHGLFRNVTAGTRFIVKDSVINYFSSGTAAVAWDLKIARNEQEGGSGQKETRASETGYGFYNVKFFSKSEGSDIYVSYGSEVYFNGCRFETTQLGDCQIGFDITSKDTLDGCSVVANKVKGVVGRFMDSVMSVSGGMVSDSFRFYSIANSSVDISGFSGATLYGYRIRESVITLGTNTLTIDVDSAIVSGNSIIGAGTINLGASMIFQNNHAVDAGVRLGITSASKKIEVVGSTIGSFLQATNGGGYHIISSCIVAGTSYLGVSGKDQKLTISGTSFVGGLNISARNTTITGGRCYTLNVAGGTNSVLSLSGMYIGGNATIESRSASISNCTTDGHIKYDGGRSAAISGNFVGEGGIIIESSGYGITGVSVTGNVLPGSSITVKGNAAVVSGNRCDSINLTDTSSSVYVIGNSVNDIITDNGSGNEVGDNFNI